MSASLDATLAALADPHRRATVDLLRQGPRRAGELAQAAGLSAPAMSRHLRALRQAGLVDQVHPNSTPGCGSTPCVPRRWPS
jgi:DNA-binding transcriptional ArsR family regulator